MLSDIPGPIIAAALMITSSLLIFLLKDIWSKTAKEKEKHDFILQQNTIALTELRVELKNLKELFMDVNAKTRKMEADINALHKSRRDKDNGKG
jgi:hypothetical protein